jgi:hypothetical protein
MSSTRPRAIVYLPASGGKRILDRNLDMLVSSTVRWRVVDHDAFVWRNREPDVNLKAGAMTMLVTRCGHSYATPDDTMVVLLQPSYLMFDHGARRLWRLASLESHLQWELHNNLSSSVAP